ncbi:outer membrane lipoprotein carrier protein LolA [Actinokineospora sp. UTMC 2448]|uniref:LolA family protein n=1 Tax=Actinokineospora sp. UTMC 2448 TaxID=2268449 RepID=UPI0021643164|nr:outer membrane lipoprotein carrier protein LolA [Actinokineospora sp. UTMC 2448]UVS77072.1 Outer membrane lipoprotein-sorting protein [Actinokineospora sp. UTMC 2448]
MDRKRTALGIAAAGTATGVVGLVLLATPAGAGETPPALPETTPEALVQSVLDADVPALAGTVELTNDLGLPIPGVPSSDGHMARVFTDGDGRFRLALEGERSGERTIVGDGATTWVWDSKDRSVLRFEGMEHGVTPQDGLADPATASRELVELMRKDSTITIDGTARVADRPVYQLVLTPKPTERTLLREVRVSVDEATRLPLRLEVLANGQAEPALSVGFSDFDTGAQDPALFRFTPPAGATVTDGAQGSKHVEGNALLEDLDLEVVGEGWDTVLVGKVPTQIMSTPVPSENGDETDPMALLSQFGSEVTGEFGTGYAITTKVGTALVTTDGRVALGAVPQQVLAEALATK